MKFKKYNVSKPSKWIDREGVEKTKWNNVGTLTIFTKDDGSESGKLELITLDKDLVLNVFPFAEKANTQTKSANKNNYSQPAPKEDYSQPAYDETVIEEELIDVPNNDEDIRVEDIPF